MESEDVDGPPDPRRRAWLDQMRERWRRLSGHSTVQLVRGSGFIFACRVTGAVLALVTQIFLARWMGANELGRYLLAFSWCILVSRLSGVGYNSSAARFIGEGLALDDHGAVRGFVEFTSTTVRRISIVVALVGSGTAFLIARTAGETPWPLVIAFGAVPILAASGVLFGFALAFSWFRSAFFPSGVLRPMLFLAGVSLFWWLRGDISATAAMLLQVACLAVTLGVLLVTVAGRLKRAVAGAVATHRRRQWTRTALVLLTISLFREYLPELSVVVAGIYLSPDQVAVFAIAYRTALLIAFVVFAIDAFVIPRAAHAWAAGDRIGLQEFVGRATELSFFVSLCAVIGFATFGRWALGLFGEEFVEGYQMLLIISVAQLVSASVGPVMPLLNVGGHEDECLKVYGSALLLVAPLVAVLASTWGMNGVGYGVASVIILSSVLLNLRVRNLMGIHPSILAAMGKRLATLRQR